MFSVFKHRDAMADVLSAWAQANDAARARIEVAMVSLERQLQEGPSTQGESRGGGARVLFQFPIAVTYEVDDASRLVRILRAWTFRRQAA